MKSVNVKHIYFYVYFYIFICYICMMMSCPSIATDPGRRCIESPMCSEAGTLLLVNFQVLMFRICLTMSLVSVCMCFLIVRFAKPRI